MTMTNLNRLAALCTALCFTSVLVAQGGAQLDQRNMAYKSGPKPLLDFMMIGGDKGEVIGTVSMIDGDQVAYFDDHGQMVT